MLLQVNSIVHAIKGNHEEAKKIQREFIMNSEAIVDDTPEIGHIKGLIHILAGDKERGLEILEGKAIMLHNHTLQIYLASLHDNHTLQTYVKSLHSNHTKQLYYTIILNNSTVQTYLTIIINKYN